MDPHRAWCVRLFSVLAAAISVVALAVAYWCCAGSELIDWVGVLLQFAIFGALGGLLTLLSQFNPMEILKSKEDFVRSANYKNVGLAVFISTMGGIGGAGAAMYFMSFNSKLKIPQTGLEVLDNCLAGFVSGFIGFALLRQVSSSFANWAKIKDDTVKAAEQSAQAKIDEFQGKMEALQDLDDCIRTARDLRDRKVPPDSTDYSAALQQLETRRAAFLDHRGAAIVLANMYYDKKDYERSIAIVSETIAAIEPQLNTDSERIRKIATKNIADLLYNRACYHARLTQQSAQNKQTSIQNMMSDLTRSCDLSPENAADAEIDKDQDFGALKNEQAFKDLLAKYKKPPAP